MIELIRSRGVKDEAVLHVMGVTPRENFMPEEMRHAAYGDAPVQIEAGQTVSQPYVVAYMLEALKLKKSDRILEIGTGRGYNTALLSQLAGKVYSVEVIHELHLKARESLRDYENVKLLLGDGHQGWKENAPFDGIIVTAAPERFPQALWEQLKEGGKMVIPIGPRGERQQLFLYEKVDGRPVETRLCGVRFVPMV